MIKGIAKRKQKDAEWIERKHAIKITSNKENAVIKHDNRKRRK